MKRIILMLVLMLLAGQVTAQSFQNKISIRQWTNDVELLKQQVLEPLKERFAQQGCSDDQGIYYRALLDEVKKLRGELNSITYLLFREILLSTGEAMAPLAPIIKCANIDIWEIFESGINARLEYTGNVFSILDIAGSL